MLNDLAQMFYNIYLPTSMAVFIIRAGKLFKASTDG